MAGSAVNLPLGLRLSYIHFRVKFIRICSATLLLAVASAFSSAQTVLADENFDDGNSTGWTFASDPVGIWSVPATDLQLTCGSCIFPAGNQDFYSPPVNSAEFSFPVQTLSEFELRAHVTFHGSGPPDANTTHNGNFSVLGFSMQRVIPAISRT